MNRRMIMKKNYEIPKFEITMFDDDNVICTSGTNKLNSYNGADNAGRITLLDFIGEK